MTPGFLAQASGHLSLPRVSGIPVSESKKTKITALFAAAAALVVILNRLL